MLSPQPPEPEHSYHKAIRKRLYRFSRRLIRFSFREKTKSKCFPYCTFRIYLRRSAIDRRSFNHSFPGTPFFYRRRFCRDFLPRIHIHPTASFTIADKYRSTFSSAGRIYSTRFFKRKNGPFTSRSRCRSDCFLLSSFPQNGNDSNERRFLRRIDKITDGFITHYFPAGIRTRFFRKKMWNLPIVPNYGVSQVISKRF